jgi:hypothetical protein
MTTGGGVAMTAWTNLPEIALNAKREPRMKLADAPAESISCSTVSWPDGADVMTGSGWLAGFVIAAVLVVIKLFRAHRVSSEHRGLGL